MIIPPRWLRLEPLTWLGAACVVWVLELGFLLALPLGAAAAYAIDCAGWTAASAAVTILARRRALREPDAATGWNLIASGGLLLAVVSSLDATLFAIFGRIPLPAAAIAAMDNTTWALFLAGLLAWTGRGHRRGAAVRAALDGTLLAASCFLLAWWANGARLVDQPDLTAFRTVRSALPFAINCTSLGVIAYLVARSTARLRGPLGWLAVGHTLLLFGALGYAWATMRGRFYPGHPLDVAFQLPLLVFAMAAVAPQPLPPPIGEADAGNDLGDVLTNLPAAAAITIGVVRYAAGVPADSATVVAALTILALLLARQFLAVRDVRRLSRTLEARVDERSRALETSQLALIRAQRSEAIGRLAGGIAHDFNNVLTAISGHVALLRDDLAATSAARESADAVQDAVRCGGDLARRLLSLAKPSSASPRAVPVRDALSRAAQLARGLARGRVTVEVVLGDGDACVYIDAVSLDQMLTNLAANAVDAMPDGGLLTMEAHPHRITVARNGSAPAPGSYVRFTLRDTGTGMDRATLSRIFEPFFTTKAEGRGTGLGLPTCYSIVTQAGGRIDVESRPNEGSCFEILLPAATGCEADATSSGRAASLSPADRGVRAASPR